MSQLVNQFWNDEEGFVISAELVIILTVAVLAMIVGLSYVQSAVVSEFNDVAGAISSLNQSYAYTGYYSRSYWGKWKSYYAGSSYFSGPRGAVLGFNGCDYPVRGGYSENVELQSERVEEPCQICRPDEVREEVIEEPKAECFQCEPGKETIIEPVPEPVQK